MNNQKTFKSLYYVSLILTILIYFLSLQPITIFGSGMLLPLNFILGVICLIFVLIFTIKGLKGKINNVNVLFPIIYLLFLIIVSIIAVVLNSKLIIPYIHYNYYISFILINYLLLNIYSLLSISK